MSLKMITKAQVRAWAPKAKADYVDALVKAEEHMRAAGILDNRLRLAHFMGQVGAETNGLTITREYMSYSSVGRIKQVWPARSRRYTEAWMGENLVKNAPRLAAWAYGGRMANKRWPSLDGYNYRGGGYIQTTGKRNVRRYCKKLQIPLTDKILDEPTITIRFACWEWSESGCNKWADQNDLLAVSKIINTGSAASGIQPNGMSHRKHWLKESWEQWGDQQHKHMPDVSDIDAGKLAAKGSETIKTGKRAEKGAVAITGAAAAVGAAQETGVVSTPELDIPTMEQVKDLGESASIVKDVLGSASGFVEFASANFWLLVLVGGAAGIYASRRIIKRRVADARLSLNLSRLF